VSVNEKKRLVMHVHVQMRCDDMFAQQTLLLLLYMPTVPSGQDRTVGNRHDAKQGSLKVGYHAVQ
jgi:hypothetical protein